MTWPRSARCSRGVRTSSSPSAEAAGVAGGVHDRQLHCGRRSSHFRSGWWSVRTWVPRRAPNGCRCSVWSLLGGVFGHMLMNWALPRVPLWLSSTITLLMPVVSSLAAWMWLDEPLTAWQLAAMGVVRGLARHDRHQSDAGSIDTARRTQRLHHEGPRGIRARGPDAAARTGVRRRRRRHSSGFGFDSLWLASGSAA